MKTIGLLILSAFFSIAGAPNSGVGTGTGTRIGCGI